MEPKNEETKPRAVSQPHNTQIRIIVTAGGYWGRGVTIDSALKAAKYITKDKLKTHGLVYAVAWNPDDYREDVPNIDEWEPSINDMGSIVYRGQYQVIQRGTKLS